MATSTIEVLQLLRSLDPTTLNAGQREALIEMHRRTQEEQIRFFVPNPGAQVNFTKLVRSGREVAYFAGNKSGKTFTAAALTVIAALGKRASFYEQEPFFDHKIDAWVGSVNYKVQREAVQAEILKLLPNREIKKIHWLQNGAIDRIDLVNGSTIGFKTYDQGRESWQGPVKHWIMCDEEPPQDIIKEARSRLTPPGARLLFSLTPLLGMTTLYREFIEEPSRQRAHVIGSTYENAHNLDPAYLEMQEQLPEEEKMSRLHGQFMRLGGLVFPEFDRKVHVIPHFDPDPRKFIFIGGMDFGADHPTAFLIAAIDIDQNVYIFKEYKQANLPLSDHALAWQTMSAGYDIKKIFADPSAKQARIEFRKRPYHLVLQPGIRERTLGISFVRTLLKNNKVFISDQLIELIYELEHHQYNHTERTDKTRDGDVKKVNDDLLDALRYMVVSFLRKSAKTKIEKSEFGKRLAPINEENKENW